MNKGLYKLASEGCIKAYKNNIDLGTTEFNIDIVEYENEVIQRLSIPGTNEFLDWVENFKLWSKKGIKISAYNAAQQINKIFKPNPKMKLMVNGHSKGATTAIAYKKLFGADYCIAFCPDRSLRYKSNRYMQNTTIFIDKDDIIPKLGFLSFGHPLCDRIYLPNDFIGFKISDHFMKHIDNFIEKGTYL